MFDQKGKQENRFVAGITFGMAVLLATTACAGFLVRSDNEDAVSGVELIRQRKADINSEVSIGEVAEIQGLKVSVSSVRATDGKSGRIAAAALPAGQTYILADVSMENVGSEEAYVSSRMQISLLNSAGETQEWAFFPALTGSIDGRIDPGRDRKGELAWVVDDDADGLMMTFGGTAFVLGDVSGYRSGSPDNQLTSERQ